MTVMGVVYSNPLAPLAWLVAIVGLLVLGMVLLVRKRRVAGVAVLVGLAVVVGLSVIPVSGNTTHIERMQPAPIPHP
jgi:hypothetical protein